MPTRDEWLRKERMRKELEKTGRPAENRAPSGRSEFAHRPTSSSQNRRSAGAGSPPSAIRKSLLVIIIVAAIVIGGRIWAASSRPDRLSEADLDQLYRRCVSSANVGISLQPAETQRVLAPVTQSCDIMIRGRTWYGCSFPEAAKTFEVSNFRVALSEDGEIYSPWFDDVPCP